MTYTELYMYMINYKEYYKISLAKEFFKDDTLTSKTRRYSLINQYISRLYKQGKIRRRFDGIKFVYWRF